MSSISTRLRVAWISPGDRNLPSSASPPSSNAARTRRSASIAWEVSGALLLLERPDVLGHLSVGLCQLVHPALPRPRLLGQIVERDRDVQDILDAAQQREGGLGVRRLGDVMRDGRPQRDRGQPRGAADLLQHSDDPGGPLVLDRRHVQLAGQGGIGHRAADRNGPGVR